MNFKDLLLRAKGGDVSATAQLLFMYQPLLMRQAIVDGVLDEDLYRNVFSVTPRAKVKLVANMLKAIHAQESKRAAREKAKAVVEELRSMKLKEAAKKVEDGIEETLTYCDFPSEHWTRIRTNNVIERLNREIRRRTRVVGSFPDGNSALMLVCARLRHVAGTQWGNKKYMNMKHLEAALEDASIAG